MKTVMRLLVVCAALSAPRFAISQAQYDPDRQFTNGSNRQAEADRLFALGNEARRANGLQELQWDQSLAAAAFYHCKWMVLAGQISHRYSGEPDLKERAAQHGARFATVEENVAMGNNADFIHEAWMKSPGHRANLLSPVVDRVGIAVVASHGMLFAVTDFAREVPSVSPEQIETQIADLVRATGIAVEDDPTTARAACATDSGFPKNAAGIEPRFIERWQTADLNRLPRNLTDHIATGKYHSVAIGSCPATVPEGSFTAYRIAALLY